MKEKNKDQARAERNLAQRAKEARAEQQERQAQAKAEREERELLRNGLKMLLQSNLTNVFYVHNELGQIEDYKLKNWYNELHEYEELGGNDYMHVLEAKMAKLKIIRTDVLGEQHYEQK